MSRKNFRSLAGSNGFIFIYLMIFLKGRGCSQVYIHHCSKESNGKIQIYIDCALAANKELGGKIKAIDS